MTFWPRIEPDRRTALLSLLCISLLAAAGCQDEKSAAPAAAPPKVVVAQAVSETVPLFLQLTGRTEAPNTVSIRSRVDGHVETRSFTEGVDVSKGDELFVIDQRPYKSELEQLRGEMASNQASLDFANQEKKRFAVLANDGTVAPEEYDKKASNAAKAQGDLNSSKAAVDGAAINLAYTTVTAPIDGRVGRVLQDVGNLVSANDTVLVELVQMDPLHVYVSPSERDFLTLEKYQAKNDDLPVTISLVDGTKHPHAGTLDFASPGIDPATGTIAVRAVFPNPDRTLRPGQYARVSIELAEQPDQITVPAEAVGQDQAGNFVFVVDKDNKAEMRRVEAGRTYEGKSIVNSGLKAGETVIIKGQQRVRSGTTVEVDDKSTGKAGG